MRPGPKTRSCLRHRSNKPFSGYVSSGGHATTRRPRGSAQKRCAISTASQDQNRNQVRVTFAPAHANHRLNYSLTTYPPTTFLRKVVLLKMCTFISTVVLGRGSISPRREGKGEENFNVFFPRGSRIRSGMDVNPRMMQLSLSL